MTTRVPFAPRILWLRNDLLAGTTVFLIALPLCLGIALASGAPIISGLLSGIVGGIVVGIFSGSHTSVSGPAAGLTAIIATQIATLGSFSALLTAVIIAGILQIIFGMLRAGFVAEFFPTSVIKGLLAAIGFILILKQIPHFVGYDQDFEGEMAFVQHNHETTFSALFDVFFQVHYGALAVGIFSLLLLVFWYRINFLRSLRVPPPLIVVVVGTLLSVALNDTGDLWSIGSEHRVDVPIIAGANDFFKIFIWPNLSLLFMPKIWLCGFSLALVASLETLLNLEAVDKIDPQQRRSPPNRELIAQGFANIILGLIGGLPVTSVIVRSSVNINAGVRSKMSTIIHGVLLLVAVLLFPFMLNAIPLSCLAAILIVTGQKLASPKIFKQMWAQGPSQFLPFIITFSAIVFTDLLIGIVIGLSIGLLFVLKRNLSGSVKLVVEHHLSGVIHRIILQAQVSFLNRAFLNEILEKLPMRARVVFDASDAVHIDADVLDLIKDFKDEFAKSREILVSLVGFNDNIFKDKPEPFADYITPDLQKNATPAQVLLALKKGNHRVLSGQRIRRDLATQIKGTSEGQFPVAVVLSCIDSRAPAELIFDLGIGDIFSVRMAGNVISEKVLGSIEFACSVAGAKLIVVMGHTRCGAVSAAVRSFMSGQSIYETTGCLHLGHIVSDIQQVIKSADLASVNRKNNLDFLAYENDVIRANVQQSMNGIATKSDVIREMLKKQHIDIVGCIYDVSTGSVEFLDPLLSTTHDAPMSKGFSVASSV